MTTMTQATEVSIGDNNAEASLDTASRETDRTALGAGRGALSGAALFALASGAVRVPVA